MALAVDSNGTLYAGGWFTTAGGTSANRIASWNGSNWSALESGMNNSVKALAVESNDTLYAGGSFTTAGNQPSSYIARWIPNITPTATPTATYTLTYTPTATPIPTNTPTAANIPPVASDVAINPTLLEDGLFVVPSAGTSITVSYRPIYVAGRDVVGYRATARWLRLWSLL